MVEYCGTRAGIPLVFSPPCSILLFLLFFSFFFFFFSSPFNGGRAEERGREGEPPFAAVSRPCFLPSPSVVFLSLLTCGTSRNLSIIIVLRAWARGLSLCLLSLSLSLSFHSIPRYHVVSRFRSFVLLDLLEILTVFGWNKDQQVGFFFLLYGFNYFSFFRGGFFIIVYYLFENFVTPLSFES